MRKRNLDAFTNRENGGRLTEHDVAPLGGNVSIIQWSPRYVTGLALIDRQHQELFRRLNAFHEVVGRGGGRTAVGDTLRYLMEYVEAHFREEEEQMLQASYPDYPHHKGQHLKLEAKSRELLDQFKQGEEVLTVEISAFLSAWVNHHILKEDMEYIPWFQSRGLGQKPLPRSHPL